jgi:hypothetical protein
MAIDINDPDIRRWVHSYIKEELMKPTIGRIVIYHPSKDHSDGVLQNGGAADVPAVIVAVWSETCVNLKVLTDAPHDAWVTSRCLGPGEGEWSWPERVT